ncbi:hypothetical protein [Nitrosopumilus adriaticus]|uniref:Uncharacterized protein n=1 Tax=Nitrosopumilus adriaticus TaxID=1580092 RepID=A0A0D5C254_9ARCH|nr:hypothetical protein [Nitrosopumilus adriaticus]AJW70869.1 hypothetical protein NADRNF5_1181 [Nitrosopumilus adriaticus]
MDILIGLVIAMFIITAVYVGYHAMQQPVEEGEGHNVELEILNENTGIIQASHNHIIFKVVI